MALARAFAKATARPRKCAKMFVNAAQKSTDYAKLDDEITEVVVENLTAGKVDVFIGAVEGAQGFPDFSVDKNIAKRVPMTSSGSSAITIYCHDNTGFVRVWVSNQDHGYGAWSITA